ncbi:MAG: CsbD-like [Ilumatobacteraceae bacterium]|nr:CsbD-like [Ilumatobacteraceae bacterium]
MGSKMDDTKGRLKEAAGVVADDKDLQREGKLDQAGSSVKNVIEQGKGTLSGAVDSVKDKLSNVNSSDSSKQR